MAVRTSEDELVRRADAVRRPLLILAALLTAALVTILPGSSALAADDGMSARILDYKIDYTLDSEGVLHGRETIKYRFPAGARKHGIVRYIQVRQTMEGQEGQYRLYDFELLGVSSPTGAPAEYTTEDVESTVMIRIGDPGTYVSGTQTYVIDYAVRGTLNRITSSEISQDQLYLNAVGNGWTVPITKATVTLTAPVASLDVTCWRGERGVKDTCPATKGTTSTYTATDLVPKQGMSIVAAYPEGTFTETDPIIVKGDITDGGGLGETLEPATAAAISTSAYAVGGLVPALVAGLMGLAYYRTGRDERYAGITPGLSPGLGQEVGTERVARHQVAVQFHPPAGARPGMVGTIIDETANTIDVSATVIDLAVRGFLRIEETESGLFKRTDWLLTKLDPPPGEQLARYEEILYDGLFAQGSPVRLSELKHTFRTTLERVQGAMYDEAVTNGWFRRSPESTRQVWRFLGTALIVLGAIVGFFATGVTMSIDAAAGRGGIPSGLILGGGIGLAGLIIVLFAQRMPAKLPEGSAVHAQSLGFRQYLATAEANQIRFEEAQSIFSRYLPYAIVFGVADHWAKVFKEVAEAAELAGYPMDFPTWYIFYGGMPDFGGFDSIASSMDDFSTMAAGTFTSSPAASGQSGFNSGSFGGGGGFSGGGGFGGGGGGDW